MVYLQHFLHTTSSDKTRHPINKANHFFCFPSEFHPALSKLFSCLRREGVALGTPWGHFLWAFAFWTTSSRFSHGIFFLIGDPRLFVYLGGTEWLYQEYKTVPAENIIIMAHITIQHQHCQEVNIELETYRNSTYTQYIILKTLSYFFIYLACAQLLIAEMSAPNFDTYF